MGIIAFWSNVKEETAKTSSIVAVSTLLTLENNYRCFLTQTHHKNNSLESCFWNVTSVAETIVEKEKDNKKDMISGMDGVLTLLASNRLTPEMISNYTKVVFKNRLEVLVGEKEKTEEEYNNLKKEAYKRIIHAASKKFDIVLVDLNKGYDDEVAEQILKIADVIVVNISQRADMINDYLEIMKNEVISKEKTVVLLGRYDRFSKYNDKNIAREIGVKEIYAVPYNTLFFEACNEGKVVDFMIKYRNVDDQDRNAMFIKETRRAANAILEKMKETEQKKR